MLAQGTTQRREERMRVGVQRIEPVPDALPAELARSGGDQGGLAVPGGCAHEEELRLRRRGDRRELVGADARRLQARRAELRRRLGLGVAVDRQASPPLATPWADPRPGPKGFLGEV